MIEQDDIWMQTLGGNGFSLTHPTPAMVDWHHVAIASSRIARFNGQTKLRGILSIAQHQNEGALAILRDTGREDAAAAFAIHDAHEWVIGDIAQPVGVALAWHAGNSGHGYIVRGAIRSLKRTVDVAMHAAAGIPYPLARDVAEIVKEYDVRMCRTERDARMDEAPALWREPYASATPVEGCDLWPWAEETVAAIYYRTLQKLLPCFHEAIFVDSTQVSG